MSLLSLVRDWKLRDTKPAAVPVGWPKYVPLDASKIRPFDGTGQFAATWPAAYPKEISVSISNQEPIMATVPVIPAVHHNAFVRFIDAIGHFLVKAEPVLLEIAVEAEPFLAFTPIGPEYDLAVNAIVGAQKTAVASIAAGANLSNTQKFTLAVQAATPGLNAILTSKGVTADTETHIANWMQLVFNILAGPIATKLQAKPVVLGA